MRPSMHCLVAAALASCTVALPNFSPARPPALPLAVKSPYLNTWLKAGSNGGNGGYLAGQWPVFWDNQITGWSGLVRVDGTLYTWMGAAPGPVVVKQTAYEYTATRSIFIMNVDSKVGMNITFLSPITPHDLKRQSLIFTVVSGDRSAVAQWDYGTSDGVAYHKVYRQNQLPFGEEAAQAEWGDWYWAIDEKPSMSYQSGEATVVRGQFSSKGSLANTVDTNYRAIHSDWPVFAFASDLGKVNSNPQSTLFSLGLAQEDAVQFAGFSPYGPVPSLWRSHFDNGLEAITFFHHDFKQSSSLSTDFDAQVEKDSLALGGQDYLALTSLSARQAFAATELCGTLDKTYLFLKEISSNGNVNTADVIFPAYPIFLYSNPELLRLLLEPLIENQESGNWPNKYAIHDIGARFPNATGHTNGTAEYMPLEECGNMVIMALAYAQKNNDADYLGQHYDILKQWTGYLVDEALYPADQMSTDDFSGALANQTNLALKGIIGIKAMSVIANITGNADDSSKYVSIADEYISKWQDLAIAKNADPPHTSLSYGDDSSYGLLYNLFADTQLGLDLVPRSVYDMQSSFYPSVMNKYGVPLDTRHSYTKADWQVWSAAIASTETRNLIFQKLVTWINETPTDRALTDLYETISGDYPLPVTNFVARPVVGGIFAPMII